MDASLLIDLNRQMALCRRFEEAAARSYARGKINGFLQLYIGQEAVAVGAISAAAPTDYIVATYLIEHGVTDLIAEGALALTLEATTQELRDTVHAHPRFGEALRDAALAAEGEASNT